MIDGVAGAIRGAMNSTTTVSVKVICTTRLLTSNSYTIRKNNTRQSVTTTRQEILKALAEMSDRYPDWRFGQMVSNISCWAKGPTTEAIWDVEDQQFLETIKKHLETKLPKDL